MEATSNQNQDSSSADSANQNSNTNETSSRKRKSLTEKEEALRKLCEQFIEDDWKMCGQVRLTNPVAPAKLPRFHGQTRKECLFQFLNSDFWDMMKDIVNRNLIKSCDVTKKVAWYKKPASVNELVQVFGAVIAIENTYGNDTHNFREHYLKVRQMDMGIIRFEALYRAFNPTIEELLRICDLLHFNFSSLVSDISVAAIDEALIRYQPSDAAKVEAEKAGEPIPVVFIPRKPHPNGLLLYLSATYLDHPAHHCDPERNVARKLPYILDVIPHLSTGDWAPAEIATKFMDRWHDDSRPHLVFDSAFGSVELLDEVRAWGGVATAAVTPIKNATLWQLLGMNVPAQNCRIASNSEGVHASISIRLKKTGDYVFHQAMSTGFKHENLTAPTIDPSVNNNNNSPPSQLSLIPRFERQYLESKSTTIRVLREICQKWNIKQGKKKGGYVNNILKRVSAVHNNLNQLTDLQQQVKTQWLENTSQLNEFYGEFFNIIDIADGYWYSVDAKHGTHQWKSRLLFSILRYAVMNGWSFFVQDSYEEWTTFRENLASQMME